MKKGSQPREHRSVEFSVFGEPAAQGSKSFKGMRNGRGVMVESSTKVKPWRNVVAMEGMVAMRAEPYDKDYGVGKPPLDGPLCASIVFTLLRPPSAPKYRRWPDRKPDLSKLLRSTEDALVTSGVIADDARIVSFKDLRKVYVGDVDALPMPGARIKVETLV